MTNETCSGSVVSAASCAKEGCLVYSFVSFLRAAGAAIWHAAASKRERVMLVANVKSWGQLPFLFLVVSQTGSCVEFWRWDRDGS